MKRTDFDERYPVIVDHDGKELIGILPDGPVYKVMCTIPEEVNLKDGDEIWVSYDEDGLPEELFVRRRRWTLT